MDRFDIKSGLTVRPSWLVEGVLLCSMELGAGKTLREVLNEKLEEGLLWRLEYKAEKRAALELWADALDCIVMGSLKEIDSYHLRRARLNGGEKIQIG